jgi:hypothetical protein
MNPKFVLKECKKKKRPTALFVTLRIRQAIAWIRKLLAGVIKKPDGSPFLVQRWFSLAHRQQELKHVIRTDASPYGMGAVLFLQGVPISWIAIDWSADDFALLKAKRGDPAWQAEWELLAILLALDTWMPLVMGNAAALTQSDATAALFATRRGAGRTPAMNALCAEIALRLEAFMLPLEVEHFHSVINFECDALSRLSQGAKVPERIAGLPRLEPQPRSAQFFWAWPRTLLNESNVVQEEETGQDA